MIYMVEHIFGLPAMEDEWNAFYTGYLAVLLRVPEIRTAQRFMVAGSTPSKYMAIYNIDSDTFLGSAAYKNGGGGGAASARFRPAYREWRRNLYETRGRVPEVPQDHVLVVADRETPGSAPFEWLRHRTMVQLESSYALVKNGLLKTPPYRGIAVLPAAESARLSGGEHGDITIYTPLTRQLTAEKT